MILPHVAGVLIAVEGPYLIIAVGVMVVVAGNGTKAACS